MSYCKLDKSSSAAVAMMFSVHFYCSSEGSSTQSPAAVILCLPQVRLESAKSHVLDEPVPRNSRRDTLPWDCTLSQCTLLTIARHRAYYLLEPTTVKASLAAQQEGTGVTVHVDTLALSFSEKQVRWGALCMLLCNCYHVPSIYPKIPWCNIITTACSWLADTCILQYYSPPCDGVPSEKKIHSVILIQRSLVADMANTVLLRHNSLAFSLL